MIATRAVSMALVRSMRSRALPLTRVAVSRRFWPSLIRSNADNFQRSFSATSAIPPANAASAAGRLRRGLRASMKRLNTPESKARMAKSASNFRKRVNAAAIGGAIAFSVYSVLSESAHRRRIISQYEEGTGPATKSNLREFLGDNVSLGEELHEEEEDGPLREALNNFLLNHGITSADIPKLLTMVAGLKYIGWGLTMLVSLRFRPIKHLFRMPGPKRLLERTKARWPKFWAKAEAGVVSGAGRLAETRFFKWVSGPLGQKPESVAMGLAEGLVLYKATVLIQIPLIFFLAMKYFTTHANLVQVDPQKPDELYENWQEVVEITTNQRQLVPRRVRNTFGEMVNVNGVTQLLAAKFGVTHWDS